MPEQSPLPVAMAQFEKSIGLREGFIQSLKNDGDDWSFVIKLHAILEAGLGELITHEIGRPELQGIFSQLSVGGRFGKLAFASGLGVLDVEADRFIRAAGEIRNVVVHNVANVDFDLSAYLGSLKPEKFKSTRAALDLVFLPDHDGELIAHDDRQITTDELFRIRPRSIIVSSIGLVLFGIHLRTVNAKANRESREAVDVMFREYAIEQMLNGPFPSENMKTLEALAPRSPVADDSTEPPAE